MNEDKPPQGNINSAREYLYNFGTLRVLCSGVRQSRFGTRFAWGVYRLRELGKSHILETSGTNK